MLHLSTQTFPKNIVVNHLLNGEKRRKSKRLPAQRRKNRSAICNDVIGQNWSRGPCPTPPEAIQSTFRSLEIHSKRRNKICICSVILGEVEPFRNYKGLRIIFPKILDVILMKVRIFRIPLSVTCFNRKFLGFLFLRKLP